MAIRCKNVTVQLEAGGDRTLYATWTCVANIPKKTTTAISKFKYIWQYYTDQGIWFNTSYTEMSRDATDGAGTVQRCQYSAPANASKVRFRVKAISKYKNSKKKTYYWTDEFTTWVEYQLSSTPTTPDDVSAPTVTIEKFKLTAENSNITDENTNAIEYEVVQDNQTVFTTGRSMLVTTYAAFSCDVDAGHNYKVRARGIRVNTDTDQIQETGKWSDYTDTIATIPSTPPRITSSVVNSQTQITLGWDAVPNATSYTVEYTTDKSYFDVSGETQSQSVEGQTSMIITGLTTGSTLYFRLKATNSQGDSGWSEILTAVIGKVPAAPTTWSETSTAKVGDTVYLYWVHNSQDGSNEDYAEIELTIGGSTANIIAQICTNPQAKGYYEYSSNAYSLTSDTTVDTTKTYYMRFGSGTTADPYVYKPVAIFGDDYEERTFREYTFDTANYNEGAVLTWRVRTKGVMPDYGEWSVQRMVKIYAPATIIFDTGSYIPSTFSAFPLIAELTAGPVSQNAVFFTIIVSAVDSYQTEDYAGRDIWIGSGDVIFSKNYNATSNTKTINLTAGDLKFENGMEYEIKAIVSMDSGLTASATKNFTVSWAEEDVILDAEIGADLDKLAAFIRPYVMDDEDEEQEGYTLSVYRREFDGSFLLIATGIDSGSGITITDPHPALDEARYRLSAVNRLTGQTLFADIPGYPIGEPAIVIQWDESYRNYGMEEDDVDDDPANPQVKGAMLKLPYNVDVQDKYSPDVTFASYIGREHPVSYYGTQQGHTASWKTEIPADDKDTIYALRRLSVYKGDVYVREPSGTGYWANVKVSFAINHLAVTIPITFEITRVVGGVHTAGDIAEDNEYLVGDVLFYIDNNGDLKYERDVDTQVDFYLRDGYIYVESME